MSTTCYSRRREEIRSRRWEKRTDRNHPTLNGSPQRRNGHEKRESDNEVPDSHCMDLFPSTIDQLHNNEELSQKILLSPKSPARKKPCSNNYKSWSPINTERNAVLSEEEFPKLESPEQLKTMTRNGETPDVSKSWANIMDEEDAKQQQKSRSKRRLVMSDVSNTVDQKSSVKSTEIRAVLTDEHRLRQRQKQIDYGKNTVSYGRYISLIPRYLRSRHDPQTPDKFQPCSARSWSGQIKAWRKKLHFFDPPQSKESTGDLKTSEITSGSQGDTDTESTSSDSKIENTFMDIDDDIFSSSASTSSEYDQLFKDLYLETGLVDDGYPL